jgi:hypothetical protein
VARTIIPIIVGFVLGLPVADALGITEDQATQAVGSVIAAVWYIGVRCLEVYVTPRLGWLLGVAAAPEYQPKHAAVEA